MLNETPERMFARFNVLAKPLEDERPRVMTREQLKTTYQIHLKVLLSSSDAELIDRDIRESERYKIDRGLDPLSRHEIHELVLRHAREKAVEEAKLRAVLSCVLWDCTNISRLTVLVLDATEETLKMIKAEREFPRKRRGIATCAR